MGVQVTVRIHIARSIWWLAMRVAQAAYRVEFGKPFGAVVSISIQKPPE